MRLLLVLRDVGIIFGLTLLGGIVIGIASAGSPHGPMYIPAIAISNLLFSIVGFFVVGCLTVVQRWRHLAVVGIGVWLSGLINVAFMGGTLMQWFLGCFFVAITLAIGGGLAALVKRRDPNQPPEPTAPSGRGSAKR